jgi:N-glycosylase/DNA lyase
MPIKVYNSHVNNNELNNLLKNNTLFVGVFSETCSHCINMKPEWNKFKSLIMKEKLNGTILEINAKLLSSINNPLINNNVEGFPSLFVISNNKHVANYELERTGGNFLKFFKKYIPAMSLKKTINKTSNKTLKNTSKKSKRLTKINPNFIKKSKNYSSKLKLGENISLCKHAKNGITGCSTCCSQFKKRKTYKRCIKRCMK